MYYSFPSRHHTGYQIELNHFVDVAKGLADLSITGKMTQAVSKIATACEESARKGVPIKLQWDEKELPPGYVKANGPTIF